MFGKLFNVIMRNSKHTFSGEVSTEADLLSRYSKDTSCFRVAPQAVYYPKNTEDIVALVALAHKDRVGGGTASLTVRAGGTCMSGGPLNKGWIVDLTKHMHAISIDPKGMTATVEMGAYFRDIEAMAAKYGLMFAPYPSSRKICGIGGMLGNNASGEKSLRNGATSDNVLSLEIVCADGSVMYVAPKKLSHAKSSLEKELLNIHTRHSAHMHNATGEVKKAASGYRFEKIVSNDTFNLVPLIVGAQGTLGIVTKATLKLTPIPQHTALCIISAQTLEDIPKIIETISLHNPEGVETFDINTFKMAQKHLAEHANRVVHYIDANAHIFILAQFSEATIEETSAQAEKCRTELESKGYMARAVTDPTDTASAWEVRRNSFLLMRDHNEAGFRAVPCIEDVIVPLSELGVFIGELHAILTKRNINYGFHGHIGDGSLRIIPIFNFSSPTLVEEIIALTKEVFALVKCLKGNMSADHSDGFIRSPFLKEFYGDELFAAFEDIKRLFDPENLMNPNKKVPNSLALISRYIDRN